jgi:hypothetical protein
MDQWKQKAIGVLRQMEFGKTILDYGDSDDAYEEPWEDHVCPICECEGYHADYCELQQLLTPPREQLMLLKELCGKEENLWFVTTDAEVDLKITKEATEEFISDMLTYGLIESAEEYGDWFYRVTCSQQHIDELLENTEDAQGTSVEQNEKEEQ